MGSSKSKLDPDSYEVISCASNHFGRVEDVSVFKDPSVSGYQLFTAGQDGKIILQSAQLDRRGKGKKITVNLQTNASVTLLSAWVMCCDCSPKADYFASGGLDNTVTLYKRHLTSGVSISSRVHSTSATQVSQWECGGCVYQLLFLNDAFLACCSGDGRISLLFIDEENNDHLTPILTYHVSTKDVMSIDCSLMEDSNRVLCVFGDCHCCTYALYLDPWVIQSEIGSGILQRVQGTHHDIRTEKRRDDSKGYLSSEEMKICRDASEDINTVSISFGNNAALLCTGSDDGFIRVYIRGSDEYIGLMNDIIHPTFQMVYKVAPVSDPIPSEMNQDGSTIIPVTCCSWITPFKMAALRDPDHVTVIECVHLRTETMSILKDTLPLTLLKDISMVLIEQLSIEIVRFLKEYRYQCRNVTNPAETRLSGLSRCDDHSGVFVTSCWDKKLYFFVPHSFQT